MGLNNRVFALMAKHCRGEGKALAAGYPDCIVTGDVLRAAFGDVEIPADAASDIIVPMHGMTGQLDYARDAKTVFKLLGYDLTVIDIHQERGCEIVVDLNHPYPLGQFDLVLDHGTIEHCFNIAQAAINLAQAVKPGGYIVQHLPLSMANHGFYNINPTWFTTFYPSSGFEILHFEGMIGNSLFDPPAHQRFNVGPNALLTVVARRTQVVPIGYPMQGIYA